MVRFNQFVSVSAHRLFAAYGICCAWDTKPGLTVVTMGPGYHANNRSNLTNHAHNRDY